MRVTLLVVLVLLSDVFMIVAVPAVALDVGPPPALAPGQAPPLPKQGPLADPRSSDQVGFPKVLTEYAISPTSLRPAQVALGRKLFFEPRLSGDGTVACATCHDPARAANTAKICASIARATSGMGRMRFASASLGCQSAS